MARTGVHTRLPPARRLAHEPASSRVAAEQSAGLSPPPTAQMLGPQSHASVAPARRRTPPAAARRPHRYDHCPPLLPPTDARHTRGPSAALAEWSARYGAARA